MVVHAGPVFDADPINLEDEPVFHTALGIINYGLIIN
jgi:hypothetical protein